MAPNKQIPAVQQVGGASIVSPLRSCLRRLRITLIRYPFNVGGKLWIPCEHLVEGVFVERVQVTVVHSADAGSAGLAEEEGEFPEELAICKCGYHCCTVRSKDFYRAATDEVHVIAILSHPKDKITWGEDHGTQLQGHFAHEFVTCSLKQGGMLNKVTSEKQRHVDTETVGQFCQDSGFIVPQLILPEVGVVIAEAPLQRGRNVPIPHESSKPLHLFAGVSLGEINCGHKVSDVTDDITIDTYP